MEQQIRFCTSADGTRIAYATYGEPAGRALVFVQNFELAQELCWKYPGTRALYEGLASVRRLVTFDSRGVGGSQRDVDDLAISAQLADLAAVIDELGLERVDLMGFVTGGALAAAYAVEHPERVGRLLLWQPIMRTSDAQDRGSQDLALSIRVNWSLARRSWAAINFATGPTDVQRWYSNMLRDSLAPEVAARHIEVVAEFDGSAILGNVQAPTLVLDSSESHDLHIVSVRAVASLIPGARLVTLEGNWVTPPGDPSQMLAAIQNFLDEADAEAAPAAPSGTAIILFADIANSTALTERMGDAAFRDNARDLDTALRKTIASAGGTAVEGKLLGDGVLAVFGAAREAIACSRGCHAAAEENGLELHVGIHAGDVIREEGNVFGGAVNIAARVADASGEGETLVSQTVRDLARTSAGVAFEDRGEHELKGIDEPQRLFAVRWREDG